MVHSDYSNPAHQQIQLCRAHAEMARSFADNSAHRAGANIWFYIARARTDLAELKERLIN